MAKEWITTKEAFKAARAAGMKSWGSPKSFTNWLGAWRSEGRTPPIARKQGKVDKTSLLAALDKYMESLI